MILAQMDRLKNEEKKIRAELEVKQTQSSQFEALNMESKQKEKARIEKEIQAKLAELQPPVEESKDAPELLLDDLADSDVSEVELEELRQIENEAEGQISKEMLVQLKLAEESQE